MLRTMLESLISPKTKSIRFELSNDHIPELEAYYNHTAIYQILLRFNGL